MDSHLIEMIPCVMDFLELDANELLTAGFFADAGEEGILASFLTKQSSAEKDEANACGELSTSAKMLRLSPQDFRLHFRMSYSMFCDLLTAVKEHSSFLSSDKKRKSGELKLETKLQIALYYLGSLHTREEIADYFNIDQSSLELVLNQTVNCLYELMQVLISWPDKKQFKSIIDGFQKSSRLPNIIGAIDVTHINLQIADSDKKFYLNSCNRPTVILQAVCDHSMKFLHCCTGWPGCVDDVSVLHDSDLFQDVKENQSVFFPNDCMLVGDLAYPLYSWLLTPYEGPDSNLNDKQIQYNFYLNIAHNTISKAFLHLRRRFPRLENIDVSDLENVVKIILVTCALHNFCIDQGDTDLFMDSLICEERLSTISEPDNRFSNTEAFLQRDKISQAL
ncbi:unnamed protein product [Lymnaea stagnalis]|uniref:DDE Tnp4 domain-containing protein n=1 Tax=Lymnaea stagnalis TaxID=6523 RepID=A0AAV2H0Z7_LYMST